MPGDQMLYITKPVSSEEEFERALADGSAPKVNIETYTWGGEYRPESTAAVCPDYETGGLWVALETTEPAPLVRTTAFCPDGPVWEDSCLEFFFNPTPQNGLHYLNFENNSAGTMLCGVHNSVFDGQPGRHTPDVFRMRALREAKPGNMLWWRVRFFIPFSYIQEYFPSFKPEAGMEIAGNFYKCGDSCPKPHYGSWAAVNAPKPNFHVPASFAPIRL